MDLPLEKSIGAQSAEFVQLVNNVPDPPKIKFCVELSFVRATGVPEFIFLIENGQLA
jgi:hypothetical protein